MKKKHFPPLLEYKVTSTEKYSDAISDFKLGS